MRIQAQKLGFKDQATMQYNFDPIALDNLKEIIKFTDANIVVSSTWRLQKDDPEASIEWKELIRNLDCIGVSNRIIGVTPTIKNAESLNVRWMEIKQWMQDNTDIKIEKFVIIDDGWDMGEYTKHNFARCWSYSGLTNEVKEKVLSLFNE